MTVTVRLDQLEERAGGNYRGELDRSHVTALARAIDRGAPVPAPAVRDIGHDRYVIVSGHHRIAAHRELGRLEVSAELVDVDDAAALLLEQIAENACRLEVSAVAEAEGFAELVAAGLEVATIAERTGRTAGYVRRRLELLELDPAVRPIADRYGFKWAELLTGLPPALQREAGRVLELEPITFSQWARVIDRLRARVADAGAMTFDNFELAAQEWSTDLRQYVTDAVATDVPAVLDPLELVGPAEIATRLGVKPATVHQWRTRGAIVEPFAVVTSTPVWRWSDVEAWARSSGRL